MYNSLCQWFIVGQHLLHDCRIRFLSVLTFHIGASLISGPKIQSWAILTQVVSFLKTIQLK